MKDRKQAHRTWMFNILKHIYSNPIGKHIWFKWWTALYFFYQLPRFSVDLDFDILKDSKKNTFDEWIQRLHTYIEQAWWSIKKDWTLQHSHRYIVQYWWQKKLKLEFGTHQYPNIYEAKDLFWLQIQTMSLSHMYAHKLCAVVSRWQQRGYLASRDLFDIHFLLSQHIQPNENIIKIRSNILTGNTMNIQQRYTYLIDFIHEHEIHFRKHILDGLGELIDDTASKHRIKETLVDELLEQLHLASMH